VYMILFVNLVAVANTQLAGCDQDFSKASISCIANGASCTPFNPLASPLTPSTWDVCTTSVPSTGTPTGGVCKGTTCGTGAVVGDSCSTTADCADWWQSGMTCAAGVCSYGTLRYKGDGESCTAATNCLSNICTSGKCVGVAPGGTCLANNDCSYGNYCSPSSGTCAPWAALGQSCAGFSGCGYDSYGFPAYCDGTTSVCVASYSKALGVACSGSNINLGGVGSECQPGLYCNGTSTTNYVGKCVAITTGTVT